VRNTRGEAVEPTTGERAKASGKGRDYARGKDPADKDEYQKDHETRLSRIEAHLGMAKPANNMRSEDQAGGKGKTEAGKEREKMSAQPGRARH
jgi:hypothetical protein